MKKSRLSAILKEQAAGMKTADVCRRLVDGVLRGARAAADRNGRCRTAHQLTIFQSPFGCRQAVPVIWSGSPSTSAFIVNSRHGWPPLS